MLHLALICNVYMGCLFKKLSEINDLSKEQVSLKDLEEKIDILIEKVATDE
jgi:hypothetical protein